VADCALPDNLKGRRHEDWPWPASRIKRGWNAYGPRCIGDQCPICHGKSRISWPPTFIVGKGVSRWEETGPGHSVLHIKKLDGITVVAEEVYGHIWDGIEMNPGLPNFGKVVRVKLYSTTGYSPSAIQEFSPRGWMKLDPKFYAEWYRLGKNHTYYHRTGFRPDHEDTYYNKTIVGYWGLSFE